MNRRTREAVRYLGYGKHAVDDSMLRMISDSFKELELVVSAKSIYRIFKLHFPEANHIQIGNMKIESRQLFKNIGGCHQAVVFGATLGTNVDRMMRKYSITNMAKTVVLQACAAAMLEEYCDECQMAIANELHKEALHLRPRFSPGYGDFQIMHQEELLRMLDASKRIGLTMTDGYMLTPMKSVTAVIGVSNLQVPCHIEGCEACAKRDCQYRR